MTASAAEPLTLVRGRHTHAPDLTSFRAAAPHRRHRHYLTAHLTDEEFAARPKIDCLDLV